MNSREDRIANALAVAGASSARDAEAQRSRAAIGIVGRYRCGTLPQLSEPATKHYHRQFFRSFAVAFALAYCIYKLHWWETQTNFESIVKGIWLLAGGGYVVQLVLDATTG